MLILLPLAVFGQRKKNPERLDSVFVTPGSTTYLAFPSEISLVDIGNKEYDFKVEKNILLLKTSTGHGRTTNMLVKYGVDLFTCLLVHSFTARRSLYDFRGSLNLPIAKVTPEASSLALSTPNKNIENRLAQMTDEQEKFRSVGLLKRSMAFLLTNIMTDSSLMYFRFKIINRSNVNYTIDLVSFELVRKASKKLSASKKLLQSVYISSVKQIKPHEEKTLDYVLPIYSLDLGETIQVTFRESEGSRKAALAITGRAFNQSSMFKE